MVPIKLMSFNMKRNYFHFGQHCWEKRAGLVARLVRDTAPDIIGTQELTVASLSDLLRLLPEYDYVGEGRGGGQLGEFTAILFRRDRFLLRENKTFWLSATPEVPSRAWLAIFPRICTKCTLALAANPAVLLRVYNTHLDHISYFARVNGLKLIIRTILEDQKSLRTPVALTGDFNATPTSRTLQKWAAELTASGEQVLLRNSYNLMVQSSSEGQGPGRSYHGFRGAVGGQPIDYIFTSKDLNLRALEIRREQVEDAFPSDHYPIIAQLELEDGSSHSGELCHGNDTTSDPL
ncbi:endonuclease/exonuclease/phosphatase family protein [Angelakisella massiliensis]|uniref:endonuclease/exonuclease/phosphatase family protein n=1 Tax=Angelakisella massiliensis TaxID=1871018 RepID=UPI0024B1EB0E|nr:endonuclease/exonuclease/phosphatase family protein [Angelakisella massiliensis]